MRFCHLVWLSISACAPKPTPPADPADEDDTPILPAPDAAMYAHGPSMPKDPMVAAAAHGLAWDEALSGAAGAIAVSGDQPSMPAVRWAAIRAGYPYPVITAVSGTADRDVAPQGMLDNLASLLRPGDDLGLARARVGASDAWVALIGRTHNRLVPFPREVAVGDAVMLSPANESREPFQWTLVSPHGELRSGALPADVVLDQMGEWWLEVQAPGGAVVVSVPLYAGMTTPPQPVVLEGATVAGPTEATAALLDGVNRVRQAFDLPGLAVDSTLTTLADWPLEQLVGGTWVREDGEKRLLGAGFVGGPVAQLACSEATVPDCVDGWLRTPRDRARMLDPGFRVCGLAIQVRTDGITAVLNLASD
jgi:uncharacterized protein YkwD